MGDVLHRDVIITIHDSDTDNYLGWLEGFRRRLPESFENKLVGPISMGNGYRRWFFASSGSNDGWPTNRVHEEFCDELLEHFTHRAIMVVHGDGRTPAVVEFRRAEIKD